MGDARNFTQDKKNNSKSAFLKPTGAAFYRNSLQRF